MPADKFKKKINVTECTPGYSGKSASGDDYTIYDVKGVNENGAVVEQTLRSFQELPIGQLIEFDVDRYENAKYGVSFTLKLPPGMRAGVVSVQAFNDLTARVVALEQVAHGSDVTPPERSYATVPQSGNPPPDDDWGSSAPPTDDDIPF